MADEFDRARKLFRAAKLLLEAGAPGAEHERVRGVLEAWAEGRARRV